MSTIIPEMKVIKVDRHSREHEPQRWKKVDGNVDVVFFHDRQKQGAKVTGALVIRTTISQLVKRSGPTFPYMKWNILDELQLQSFPVQ